MQKILKQLFLIVSITLILTLPYFVFADNVVIDGLTGVQEPSGFVEANEFSLANIIGQIVAAVLSLLGIVFISQIIYAGYNWMYAGGDTTKIDIAKNTIKRSIVGIIIIVASFSFWQFIEVFLFKK